MGLFINDFLPVLNFSSKILGDLTCITSVGSPSTLITALSLLDITTSAVFPLGSFILPTCLASMFFNGVAIKRRSPTPLIVSLTSLGNFSATSALILFILTFFSGEDKSTYPSEIPPPPRPSPSAIFSICPGFLSKEKVLNTSLNAGFCIDAKIRLSSCPKT